jgi:aminopeptidase-like protein
MLQRAGILELATETIGDELYGLAAQIFPICRSITGQGVRDTLRLLSEHAPIQVHEVASGTQVFDWTVPREWNIRDAYIKNGKGERIVDFRKSNLCVLNYSSQVRATLSLDQLKAHIFTLPDQPDLIPYRTSYYSEAWGFCMPHRQFAELADEQYEVVIDSSLRDGSLTYGELDVPGESEDEVLLTAHVCHPSLANDNCSGLAVAALLGNRLAQRRTRYTYRFLFAPGTIGAITWLARNEARVDRIKHGLVLSCIGDGGGPTYKKSRRGNTGIDRVMQHVLKHAAPAAARILDFSPYGYDERQFCSPGFDLPIGLFQRSQFGTFPEYHTSADNLDFIRPEHLATSWKYLVGAIDILESDRILRNTMPKCEPQLGRRGLYASIGGDKDAPARNMALLWVLNLSDGSHSLLDIAERADMPFGLVRDAAQAAMDQGLLVAAS